MKMLLFSESRTNHAVNSVTCMLDRLAI